MNSQAEAKILRGPHEDLESYLEAIDQLRSNIRFFSSNKGFKSSDGVLTQANSLLSKAISKLEDEFKQLLKSYRFVHQCSTALFCPLSCSCFGNTILIILNQLMRQHKKNYLILFAFLLRHA